MTESYQDEEFRKAYDPRLMRRLLGYLRPHRGRVAALACLTLALAAAHLALPHILQEAIDGPIRSGNGRGLLSLGAAFLGTLLAVSILQTAQGYALTALGLRITTDLRRAVFRHLQGLSLSFYDRHPVGRLLTRVMGDVDALNELLSAGIVTVISDILLLGGVVAVMLHKRSDLALATFALLPVLLVSGLLFRAAAGRLYRQIRLRISRLNVAMNENITGMRTVQLFGREEGNFRQFEAVNAEHAHWWLKAIVQHNLFSISVQVMQVSATAIILGYGGSLLLKGDGVTVGLIVAFIRYAQLFFRPILDLTEKYNILLAAMASAERIFELLDTEDRIAEPAHPRPVARARGEIAFEGVGLSYRGGPPVLKGITFRAAPGERLALVGHTGAGKTSVISALLRFYEIEKGRILLDGVDTREIATGDLRRQTALVLQDPFLFTGTIAENLRLGRADIPDARLEEACRAVQIHDFVLARGGYGAAVQERGAGFSEGERQLLSFARALAFDPAILLLDEATANVDSQTEARLQEALRVLLRGRTALVIAHRLSTIRDVDRILVLHHGELREEGRHEDLLALGGLYAKLHDLQFERRRALQ